jgi:hypothetical protein
VAASVFQRSCNAITGAEQDNRLIQESTGKWLIFQFP